LGSCGKREQGGEDEGGKKPEGVSHGIKVADGDAGRDSFRPGARVKGPLLRDELIIGYLG
jgi:hypothetical protein